ncbi:hypothetical protein [Vitiosangium sp. GDMCC 1.1324]|uniref:hypothetical protein n=1 Tax=Vitiosangium sp. (strain GDMCC 1.1324) TaxID=2138576 RepID=UPI000D3A758A|nr:hypothetical protein [Vitiosangium sp. GDMCC 1.1324]PTL80908.1 hypothetical protein DAT35_26620 [Vitiosangium sp. GDMCC 1.1324]
MSLTAEARQLLRKGQVISAEIPASSAELMAWVGVHPFVDKRSTRTCADPGRGRNRFIIRGCEAPRALVEANQDLTGSLLNERMAVVLSEEEIETVLSSWGVDSSTLERDRAPYPY